MKLYEIILGSKRMVEKHCITSFDAAKPTKLRKRHFVQFIFKQNRGRRTGTLTGMEQKTPKPVRHANSQVMRFEATCNPSVGLYVLVNYVLAVRAR
jgi:hypothetical protein